MCAAGQGERVAGAPAAEAPAVAAQLDDPAAFRGAGRGRREMQLDARPVGAAGRQRGGQRLRGVDDEDVAGAQVVGEVAGVRMRQVGPSGDEHPHLVAAQPARLGRLVGLAPLARHAREHRAGRVAFAPYGRSGRGSLARWRRGAHARTVESSAAR